MVFMIPGLWVTGEILLDVTLPRPTIVVWFGLLLWNSSTCCLACCLLYVSEIWSCWSRDRNILWVMFPEFCRCSVLVSLCVFCVGTVTAGVIMWYCFWSSKVYGFCRDDGFRRYGFCGYGFWQDWCCNWGVGYGWCAELSGGW